jgi:Rrf2 family protein
VEITRTTDYAVRVLLSVAEAEAEGRVCTTAQVARRQLVPKPFVRKVVTRLASVGLLRTRRGRKGGLRLGVPAHAMTLRGILEALEGPVFLVRCLRGPGVCPLEHFCAAREVWRQAQEALLRPLDSLTLADLVARTTALRWERVRAMAGETPPSEGRREGQ